MCMFRTVRAAVSVGVMVSILTTTACYGPFNLTRTVHKWNGTIKGSGTVSAKWMKEIIFLALVIIPVYQVSTLADALVFNSIEFWTGDNPIKVAAAGDGSGGVRAVVVRTEHPRGSRIEYRRGAVLLGTAQIVEAGDRYRVLTARGEERFYAEPAADGGLTLVDPDCRVLETISADRLAWSASRDGGL